MQSWSADQIFKAVSHAQMVEALRQGFAQGAVTAPVRHHHMIKRPDEADSTLLLMPAWTDFPALGHSRSGYSGVKIVTVSPGNVARNRPTIGGSYILNDGATGEPLCVLDGAALTLLRTSAASALAADYLAQKDAEHLTVLGAGALAPHLALAHASVRALATVSIWNRNIEKAEAAAQIIRQSLKDRDIEVSAERDKAKALADADIVSAATLSTEPLVMSDSVGPGTHIDLVGAFAPHMRESDGALLASADVYADTMAGAEAEAGDILLAVEEGHMALSDIKGDLFGLCSGETRSRADDETRTVFKSVGASIEDLVGAVLIHEALSATSR
jgi:ornithine cyclodeaminase